MVSSEIWAPTVLNESSFFPGIGASDGLVTGAVEQVVNTIQAPVIFEKFEVHGDTNKIPDEGGGVNSLNVLLRKELDLFVSLVNCFSFLGLVTRHEKVDIVEVVPGEVESLKVIMKFCSERIAKYACEFGHLNDRKTVTAVHKANIMKLADGLFLESCREIAKKYPEITYNEIIIDNCCMQLVSKPEQFDVMVCYCYDFPSLFNSFLLILASFSLIVYTVT
ncbi:putative isocitrate dehydrogenase (NAD(+)) [Helianthus annuus]|uniref:Isocitrate dehydrogenase (NAD(+)) n=1 Tax=Helianthus annuus TaxID=4232 RepID=A0A9K3J9D4_HELAN|nr:putative isocitrate dehydrogenase (NAD(+)) [Helianthus annuus]KAJ0597685.1 putative isocitrate dehydrogenase (NAD(+)) [Helianthus annuus]KAJ0927690.1 putative isocitrate dehydrogenase (NAD(+)) [Helianthus annuus]